MNEWMGRSQRGAAGNEGKKLMIDGAAKKWLKIYYPQNERESAETAV